MGRILGLAFVVAGLLIAAAPAAARASSPDAVALPPAFLFPESITAGPNGELYVSSLVTGEIVRIAPGSGMVETFVADDVNVGTGGTRQRSNGSQTVARAGDQATSRPGIRFARLTNRSPALRSPARPARTTAAADCGPAPRAVLGGLL